MEKSEMMKLINKTFENFVVKNELALTQEEKFLIWDAIAEGARTGFKIAQEIVNKHSRGE